MNEEKASGGSAPPARRPPAWGVRVIAWLAGAAVIGLLMWLLGAGLVERLYVRRALLAEGNPSVDEQWVAMQLLAAEDLGLPRPQTILALMERKCPAVRRGAALSLDAWPRERGAGELKRYYGDAEALVRIPALIAGADCGDPEALQPLCDLMKQFETSTPEYRMIACALADGAFREAGDDFAAKIAAGQAEGLDLKFLTMRLEKMLSKKQKAGEHVESAKLAPAWQGARSEYRSIADFRQGEKRWAGRIMVGPGRAGKTALLQLTAMAEAAWLVVFWLVVLLRSRRGG